MVKAELGYDLTANVSTADDQQLYRLIDSEQQRLAADYDWPFLFTRADVNVAARYSNLPTTIVFERPVAVWRKSSNLWCPIKHGISELEYNQLDSDLAIKQDYIQRC